jgi:hypothetical protein
MNLRNIERIHNIYEDRRRQFECQLEQVKAAYEQELQIKAANEREEKRRLDMYDMYNDIQKEENVKLYMLRMQLLENMIGE